MKIIQAIVKSSKVDAVKNALVKVDVRGMTVTKVNGFGNKKGAREIYRGAEYTPEFVPMVNIQVVVVDDQVSRVIDTITSSAKTGKVGDGIIFVGDISKLVRIRTGETGKSAL